VSSDRSWWSLETQNRTANRYCDSTDRDSIRHRDHDSDSIADRDHDSDSIADRDHDSDSIVDRDSISTATIASAATRSPHRRPQPQTAPPATAPQTATVDRNRNRRPRPRQHRPSVLPTLGYSERHALATPRSLCSRGPRTRARPSLARFSRAGNRVESHATHRLRAISNISYPSRYPARHPIRAILEPTLDAICWRPTPSSAGAPAEACSQGGRQQSGRRGDDCDDRVPNLRREAG
jgi:hypothetical protein